MSHNSPASPADRPLAGVQQALLVVVTVCVLAISVWVLTKPPATGFETMYEAYPLAFWLLLAAGIGGTGLVFLLSSLRGDGYWRTALGLACVLYFLYTVLPLSRGWALYGRGEGDVLTHVGLAKEILATDHVQIWNIYPGFHVLMAEFKLAGFEFRSIDVLFSGLFIVLYILGIYLLARQLSGRRGVALAALFVAVVPLYDKFIHTFHPAFFSFMLLPAFLYAFERYRTTEQRAYLGFGMALAIVLIISHPVTTLYALVMLVVATAVRFVANWLVDAGLDPTTGASLIMVTGVGWLLWFGRFRAIRERLLVVVGLASGPGPTVAQTYGTQQLMMAPTLGQIVVPAIERYGPIFVVGSIAAVTVLVIFNRVRHRTATLTELWLSGQYGAGVVLALFSILTFTAVLTYNPIRNSRYAIMVATILAGLVIYWRLRAHDQVRLNHRTAVTAAVVVLVVLSIPLAVTNSYYPTMHLTHTEADGSEWFYEYHAADSNAVSHHVSSKMQTYVRGEQYSRDVFSNIGPESPVPRYLGYRTNDTLAATVDGEQTYLVTKEYDTKFHESLKEFLRAERIVYTEETIHTLGKDTTADRLYDNGGYSVWFVNGTAVPQNGTG